MGDRQAREGAWICPTPRCGRRLGVLTPRGLIVLAPRPVFRPDRVELRCPRCRCKAVFPLGSIAA